MVVVLLLNILVMVEVYFGVLMVGVVLNMINMWFDVLLVLFMLCYGEVKVLIVDIEYVEVV